MEIIMQRWEYCSIRLAYEQLYLEKADDISVIGIEFCDEERPDYLEIYQGPDYPQDSLNKAIANLGNEGWELVSTSLDRNGLLVDQMFWFKRPFDETIEIDD